MCVCGEYACECFWQAARRWVLLTFCSTSAYSIINSGCLISLHFSVHKIFTTTTVDMWNKAWNNFFTAVCQKNTLTHSALHLESFTTFWVMDSTALPLFVVHGYTAQLPPYTWCTGFQVRDLELMFSNTLKTFSYHLHRSICFWRKCTLPLTDLRSQVFALPYH